jgi:rhodanese-related sulfurtransferase
MSLLDTLKRTLGGSATPPVQLPAPQPVPEPEEIKVEEVAAADLMTERRNGSQPALLDCREDYEWRQVRIPGSLHIPMRQIPARLAEIDRTSDIVVICAHGNRSYSVAGWLIENGFRARSLRGGVVDWQLRGGAVESDFKAAIQS